MNQITPWTSILKKSWVLFVLTGLFFVAGFTAYTGNFLYYMVNSGKPHLTVMYGEGITRTLSDKELMKVNNIAEEYAEFRSAMNKFTPLINPLYQQIPVINVEMQLLSQRAELLDSLVIDVSHFIESYAILKTFVKELGTSVNSGDAIEITNVLGELENNIESVCGYSHGMLQGTSNLKRHLMLLGAFKLAEAEFLHVFSEATDRLETASYICDAAFHMTDILGRTYPYYQLISDIDQNDLHQQLTMKGLQDDLIFLKHKMLLLQISLADLRSRGLHEYLPNEELVTLESLVDVLYDSLSIGEKLVPEVIGELESNEPNFVVIEQLIKMLYPDSKRIVNLLEDSRGIVSKINHYDALVKSGFTNVNLYEIESIIDGAQAFVELIPHGEDIFGQDEEVKYLVLGHSADELRATGGFVSAIWLVTLKGLSDIKIDYFDVVKVDDRSKLDEHKKPPRGLEENMGAWVWLMRDVSWNPDFPSTAKEASRMFQISTGIEVDGVVAINQWFLADLVHAMDGIRVNTSDHITPKNFIEILEYKTDELGREYTDDVFRAVLEKLKEVKSIGSIKRISNAFSKGAREKNLMVSLHKLQLSETRFVKSLSGEIASKEGDFIFVVDSNVGWSKSDRNIERRIKYEMNLSDLISPRATLTLGYVNYSDLSGPRCEPQWRKRGSDYRSFKNACYWNFARVYLPEKLNNFSHEYIPLPRYSVPVYLDYYEEGAHSGYLEQDGAHSVYGVLLQIEAGDVLDHKIEYDLPASLIANNRSNYRYTLHLQKQPGARNRHIEIQIILPENAVIQNLQPSGIVAVDSILSFVSKLDRDIEIVVDFRKQ